MRIILIIVFILTVVGGFGQKTVDGKYKIQKTLTGIASYYHDKFHGRRMANGELHSKNKYTAACNVLPLNKWVRVTSLTNNKVVIVKITDRMARNNKRLIDLSFAAAEKLKMTRQGLRKVKVELLTNYSPTLEKVK